ncbi:uncharacterized protein RHO25_001306 [Cercospora beticola]|uniref:Uncharacterized protein n=1 Tax=Cercospora beticola TaxID=122368 RepID=A0ABZ0NAZ3_CERBT|nr:hypothetical protein RHO25_001306 [Cercospora beticola]CAK1354945.1 unnamed protein product [Cercospora beticola]
MPDQRPYLFIVDKVMEEADDTDIGAHTNVEELPGVNIQRECVRCLCVNRPGEHEDLTAWSQALIDSAETEQLQLHLLVEDTRWQVTPAWTDEETHHCLSMSFGRKLLSGALTIASPTDILDEFTNAMPDDLRDRSIRFTNRAQSYEPDLSSANTALDIGASWPAANIEVLAHFK